MKKKKIIGVAIATTILAFGIGIYYIGEFLNEPTEEEMIEAQAEIDKSFKETEKELNEASTKIFLDVKTRFPDNMKEHEMQNALHRLSHQKVITEDNAKWGYIRMTEERVNRLLEVAELNKYEWNKHELEMNGDLYVDILTRWSKSDFSRVDMDHNSIWEKQNGSVGRATGILNPWQEKEFIETTYE